MRLMCVLVSMMLLLTSSFETLAESKWEASGFEWDFSGFATVGVGKTNRDSLRYIEYDGDWSIDSDSVLGLQAVFEPVDRLSFTGQLVARGYSFDGDVAEYEVDVEWLFASFELFENGRLRLGRLRTPHQYFSDSLEIGYSYVWVRPPADGYPFLFSPFTQMDGIDYTFNIYQENSDLEVKLLIGETDGNFLVNEVDLERVWGITLLNRWDNLSIRYAFLDHTLDFYLPDYDPLIELLNDASALVPGYAESAEFFRLDDGRMRYHSLAAEWFVANWHILAERYEFEPPKKQLNNRNRGWYVSFAYPFEQVTPYVVFGAYKSLMGKNMYDQLEETYQSGLSLIEGFRGILSDDFLDGQLEDLNALNNGAIFALDLYRVSQRSYSIGARYDFLPNAALKAELQYTEFALGSTGHYIGKTLAQDRQTDPNDAMSITIVLDVVF